MLLATLSSGHVYELVHVPVEGVIGGSGTHLSATARPSPQTDTEDTPLYIYILSARGPDDLASNTHSANCKWWTININVSPPRNSIKCITCSHRNNLTQDSAHYRDLCNIPAEREGDRVNGFRDMRDRNR